MDYLKLLQHLPGMAFTLRMTANSHVHFDYCSAGAKQLYGLEPDIIVRQPAMFFQLFSPAQLLSLRESLAFCATEQLEWRLVLELQISSKKRVHQYYATPELQGDGSTLWYGLVTDITEQYVEQDSHLKNERLLSSLFDLAPLGIALVDADSGAFIKTNVALQRILACPEPQLARLTLQQLIAADFQDEHQRQLLILQHHHRFESHETQLQRGNSTLVDVVINGMLIDAMHEQKAFWIMVEDISQRKVAERQLLAEKERAEAAARAKSNFLASMSHEIRTPLNGVLGMLDVLQQGPLQTEQRRQIDIAQTSGSALLQLLNDILDFSKMDAGKLDLAAVNIDLQQHLQDVLRPFSYLAKEKQLDFHFEFSTDTTEWIKIDSLRLKQIINNLLSNAIKFTQQGGISVSANLRQQQESMLLTIDVKDTGIGISERQAAQIFDPFTQADATTTRKYGGTGLGLAICQQLCSLLGGGIHVDSTPGQGSCFTVWLTVTPGEVETIASSVTFAPIHWSSTCQVLLVDDNPVNCEVVRLMLQHLGVSVSVAQDGAEALACLQQQDDKTPYSLILMDCMMPIMDGYQATAAIRQGLAGPTYQQVPIVALTANALLGDKEKCLASGMNGYLSKPVTQQQLATEMARVLKLSQPASVVLMEPVITEAGVSQRSQPSLESQVLIDPWLWDRERFMKSLGGMDALDVELVGAFQQSLLKQQQQFLLGMETQDLKKVNLSSHSIKGSAGQMCCDALAESAKTINQAAKQQDWPSIQAERIRFEKLIADTLLQLSLVDEGSE